MNILEQLAKALEQRTPLAGSDFFGITRTEREVIISTLREFAKPPEVGSWKPIDTAPLGKMVWLWNRVWRHPYPGQHVGDGVCFVDTCTAKAEQWKTNAHMWREMEMPQYEPQSSEDK